MRLKFIILSNFINIIFIQLLLGGSSNCENSICWSPQGDLLLGRSTFLSATSTCGLEQPQRYCVMGPKITPYRKKAKEHLIDKRSDKDMACYVCDSRKEQVQHKNMSHHIQNVINNKDPKNLWWQSENNIENVSIEFQLETSFLFTHVVMEFKTFRPSAMFIEKSTDYGKTYKIIAYFAENCKTTFPNVPLKTRATKIGDTYCTETYSKEIPSRRGNLAYMVIPFRGVKVDVFSPENLNAFELTNLRINFTKLFKLGDEYFKNRNEEESSEQIVDKYYYAVTDIRVYGGQCKCFGHAAQCTPENNVQFDKEYVNNMVHGGCVCQHNTEGAHCEKCKELYNDLPWAPAVSNSSNACKKCNCNNHARSCQFDKHVFEKSGRVSGGVCDCSHNTEGLHCERCKPKYWHDPSLPFTHEKACKDCNCDLRGSTSEFCNTGSEKTSPVGQCFCKANTEGRRCDRCKAGFRNLRLNNPDGCEPCECNINGTVANQGCEMYNGKCKCKQYVTGEKCDRCLDGFYGLDGSMYEGCKRCDCSQVGSISNICDKITGQCLCRPHMTGRTCNEIEANHYCPALDHLTYEAETATEFDSNAGPIEDSSLSKYPSNSMNGYRVKVKDTGSFTMMINNFENHNDYYIALKYESSYDWQVRVNVNGVEENRLYNRKCKKYSFTSSFTIPAGDNLQFFISPDEFCFDELYYKVNLQFFIPDFLKNKNHYLLVDSIVLFPAIKKAELSEYSDIYNYCKTTFNYETARQYCENHMCPITTKLFGLKPCRCDEIGSQHTTCKKFGGQCPCRERVIGRTCDTCDHETWGFSSTGCKPCACTASSSNNFCDKDNGQCKCNSVTSGKVCQDCIPGYWGTPPNCKPCDCNGFSHTCNNQTGICDSCTLNTVGESCESCKPGYYGDPKTGYHCKKCMCPAINGIQHGDSCYLQTNTESMVCNCHEGYVGENCDKCDIFYYGNPLEPNGECKRCNCNENVNEMDPSSCDSVTGECKICLYNTDGPHCENCKYGYYGEAKSKLCQECNCHPNGTEGFSKDNCDQITGRCNCLPNVEGDKCEKPKNNFYWNPEGGASRCNCDTTGTINGDGSCDEITGQCNCIDERGGKQCDECADKKWGDPIRGCSDCYCDGPGSLQSQCNKETGICICKKGVVGEACDRCDRGTTGSVPDCEPCGECFDNWDTTLKDLKDELEKLEMKSVEAAAGLINSTDSYYDFNTIFADIEAKLNDIKALLGHSSPFDHRITKLENQIKNLYDRLEHVKNQNKTTRERIEKLHNNVISTKIKMKDEADSLKSQLYLLSAETRNFTDLFSQGATTNINKYKNLSDFLENSLFEYQEKVTSMHANLTEYLNRIKSDAETYNHNSTLIIEKFNEKLNDLVSSLSKLNHHVCGSYLLNCQISACGGPGCETCASVKTETIKNINWEYSYQSLWDGDTYDEGGEEICSASIRAKLVEYFDIYKNFNKTYNNVEQNLKQHLTEARRIEDENKLLNQNNLKLLEDASNKYENFKKQQMNFVSFIEMNLNKIREIHEYITSTFQKVFDHIINLEVPNSKKFNEMMDDVDRIAAGIKDKAENIEVETADLKKTAMELNETVTKLEIEQKPILSDIQKIKENVDEKKKITEENEKKINEIMKTNDKISDEQSEANKMLDGVNSTINKIKNDQRDTIGTKPISSVSKNSVDKLHDDIKKNDLLKQIKEQLEILKTATNNLEEKISEGLTNLGSEEKSKALQMLIDLQNQIEDKKELLNKREAEIKKIKDDIKAKKEKVADNNRKVTTLYQTVESIKKELFSAIEYFDSCN